MEVQGCSSKTCNFCNTDFDNEVLYGKVYTLGDISTHYFCLLLSSNVEQRGKDTDGIFGFLAGDIRKELARGKRLSCSYCKRSGATVGCSIKKCKKVFHLPCGRQQGSLHQFFDQFKSFCGVHRPVQRIDPIVLREIRGQMTTCVICYEDIDPLSARDTMWAPCCRKNAWFHRLCVQKLALHAGYFFKCPLCNNNEEFKEAMQEFGIYVPEQDASWEMVPNAYQELLHRHSRCDAPQCKSQRGRKYSVSGTRWEIVLCRLCGSQGIHVGCGHLKWSQPEWECTSCSTMLDEEEGQDQNDQDEEEEERVAQAGREIVERRARKRLAPSEARQWQSLSPPGRRTIRAVPDSTPPPYLRSPSPVVQLTSPVTPPQLESVTPPRASSSPSWQGHEQSAKRHKGTLTAVVKPQISAPADDSDVEIEIIEEFPSVGSTCIGGPGGARIHVISIPLVAEGSDMLVSGEVDIPSLDSKNSFAAVESSKNESDSSNSTEHVHETPNLNIGAQPGASGEREVVDIVDENMPDSLEDAKTAKCKPAPLGSDTASHDIRDNQYVNHNPTSNIRKAGVAVSEAGKDFGKHSKVYKSGSSVIQSVLNSTSATEEHVTFDDSDTPAIEAVMSEMQYAHAQQGMTPVMQAILNSSEEQNDPVKSTSDGVWYTSSDLTLTALAGVQQVGKPMSNAPVYADLTKLDSEASSNSKDGKPVAVGAHQSYTDMLATFGKAKTMPERCPPPAHNVSEEPVAQTVAESVNSKPPLQNGQCEKPLVAVAGLHRSVPQDSRGWPPSRSMAMTGVVLPSSRHSQTVLQGIAQIPGAQTVGHAAILRHIPACTQASNVPSNGVANTIRGSRGIIMNSVPVSLGVAPNSGFVTMSGIPGHGVVALSALPCSGGTPGTGVVDMSQLKTCDSKQLMCFASGSNSQRWTKLVVDLFDNAQFFVTSKNSTTARPTTPVIVDLTEQDDVGRTQEEVIVLD